MPQASQLFGTNFCTTMGLLTAAGAETFYDTTVAIQFSVDGKGYSKGAVTDGATPVVDGDGDAFPALAVLNSDGSSSGKGAAVAWCLNAAGTVVCYQGDIVELEGISTDFVTPPEIPGVPDTVTPFAYQILKQEMDSLTAPTADTSTFGTTDWNSTGFTNVTVDVMTLPRRPQES